MLPLYEKHRPTTLDEVEGQPAGMVAVDHRAVGGVHSRFGA